MICASLWGDKKPVNWLSALLQHLQWWLDATLPKFESMEQLWLAFVLKEKYGKVWSGTDWVKEGD
jgi:hypothetical protein